MGGGEGTHHETGGCFGAISSNRLHIIDASLLVFSEPSPLSRNPVMKIVRGGGVLSYHPRVVMHPSVIRLLGWAGSTSLRACGLHGSHLAGNLGGGGRADQESIGATGRSKSCSGENDSDNSDVSNCITRFEHGITFRAYCYVAPW